MLFYRDRQIKKSLKSRLAPSLICFMCFLLTHLACIGAEGEKGGHEKRVKRHYKQQSADEKPKNLHNQDSTGFIMTLDLERCHSSDFQGHKPPSHDDPSSSSGSPTLSESSSDKKSLKKKLVRSRSKSRTRHSSKLTSPGKVPVEITSEPIADKTSPPRTVRGTIAERIRSSFVDEARLFTLLVGLKEKYPLEITVLLEQIVFESFTKVANLKPSLLEYDAQIKRELVDIPVSSISSLEDMSTKHSELINSRTEDKTDSIDWRSLKPGEIAQKISLRDTALIQAIKPGDIMEAIKTSKNPPETIAGLRWHFNATADWMAYEILKEEDDQKQNELINKFYDIGRNLFVRNNFHGAMQFVTAFSKPSIVQLLKKKRTREKDINSQLDSVTQFSDHYWPAIVKQLDIKNNFAEYRKLLKYCMDNKVSYLPIFDVIFADALHAYESSISGSEDAICQNLEGVAISLETLLSWQNLPRPVSPPDAILEFVCGFKEVHSDTLDELCNFRTGWDFPRRVPPPALKDWTASHLVDLLFKTDCQDRRKTLFDLAIYDGNALIHYMGDQPTSEQRIKLAKLGMTNVLIDAIISASLQ